MGRTILAACAWTMVATCGLAINDVAAQSEPRKANEFDAWVEFQPGCWIRSTTKTAVVDDSGTLRIVATRTLLTQMADKKSHSYTLVTEGYLHEGADDTNPERETFEETVSTTELPETPEDESKEAHLSIASKSIPCRIVRTTANDTTDRVDYRNDEIYPYVFRREFHHTAEDDSPSQVVKVTEVIDLEVPKLLKGELFLCALVRTTEHSTQGTKITTETMSPDMPGGVISRSIVEYDAAGKTRRVVAMEVTEFETLQSGADIPRRSLLRQSRRRSRRR